MRAGFLQFQPEFGKPESNIEKIRELISAEDFDLIVLPELANSGYLFSIRDELIRLSENIPGGRYCKFLKGVSSSKKAYIVSGICERDGDNFYNSSILVYPDGMVKIYRKLHLFSEEKLWFSPGNLPLEVYEIRNSSNGSVKIGMMVCYDWIYPEVARTLALKGAQVICHPSNLVMPYCQDAMFVRALENRVFTITANRIGREKNQNSEIAFTGKSVILDPKGNYLYKASLDNVECVIVDIDPAQALDKNINPYNNLFYDRRNESYFN